VAVHRCCVERGELIVAQRSRIGTASQQQLDDLGAARSRREVQRR
jgi:hypothetical protein